MADALDSKSSVRKDVWVRVPPLVLLFFSMILITTQSSHSFAIFEWGQIWGQHFKHVEFESLVRIAFRQQNQTMPSLESRNNNYRLIFRLNGKKYSRSLETKNPRVAQSYLASLELRLQRLGNGELSVPVGADTGDFLIFGQQTNTSVVAKCTDDSMTIDNAWKYFAETIPKDSLEDSTLRGMEIHIRHLSRLIGSTIKLDQIDKPCLQSYIDSRSKDEGRNGNNVSVQTIKKELRTLSTIWSWVREANIVSKDLPTRRLRYPKMREKPPFQTRSQIEQRIKRLKLDDAEAKELWESLFLDSTEVKQVLEIAQKNVSQQVLYPMLCLAAFTGCRRSEIMRARIEDFDFHSCVMTVHEKKRVRGKHSTRTVPIQSFLGDILQNWFQQLDSDCNLAFPISRLRQPGLHEITVNQASKLFTKTFAGTDWAMLPGWHVFRHSFASNCAAAGIDQRIINDWLGHQTQEMVRRYRHLFPNQQNEAIESVFG